MKKSDLKELIRNSIIKELEYQDDDAALGSMYSPVYEKKDKEEDIEITADETDTVEEPTADTSSTEDSALSDADQEYLNSLEDLKNKAKEMGDEKLENQIDNTITYFTRQHVVKEGDTDYARAKAAKRLGKKGEENIYGAGVKRGEKIEKKRLQKEISTYEPEEMGNLVNLNDVKTLVLSARNIIKSLKDEGFDENDIYDFIVDKITTLDDGSESLMENHERRRLQVIAGIIK
jgi:hypothetical protein